MSTYWAILEKVKGSQLRLTKIDDEILEHLKKDFPEFDPAKTIDEDEMKSKTGKERWRKFLMQYEKRVDDYNFGTMLRNNPKAEYNQEDTIFGELHAKEDLSGTSEEEDFQKHKKDLKLTARVVPRMQFYAIEIAR